MAQQLDLPLLEIAKEDFLCVWTRFELVAAAKEWNAVKKVTVLLTLLHGKLVDIYIELSDETRADLGEVKKSLTGLLPSLSRQVLLRTW